MQAKQLALPRLGSHRRSDNQGGDYRFAPPNELAALRYEYAQMSPEERRHKAVRAQWRDYHAQHIRETIRAAPRLWRHARARRARHDRERETTGIDRLLPVIAESFPARKADALANLTAVAVELTHYSRQTQKDRTAWIDTGTHACIKTMSARLGLAARTVQRALRQLEAAELIRCTPYLPDGGRQRANVYAISPAIWRVMAAIDVIARRTHAKEKRALRMLRDHPPARYAVSRERGLHILAALKQELETKSVTPSPMPDIKSGNRIKGDAALQPQLDFVSPVPDDTPCPNPPFIVPPPPERPARGETRSPRANELDFFARRLWRKVKGCGGEYRQFRNYVRHWLASGIRAAAVEQAVIVAREREAMSLAYATAILRAGRPPLTRHAA